ncbi:MAG: TlpA family protein disulfide reductase [Planctomycetia bacterium]|nr:TlpA family protein disulfide reductase [Planctomycetia bacterium]
MNAAKRWTAASLLCLALCCLGCGRKVERPSQVGVVPATTAAPPTAKTVVLGPAVPVRSIKHDGLAEVLKEQQGKVVLLNFWSIDCPACLSEIPELIELRKEHEKDGLVVIGLNLDTPENALARDRGQAFLRGVQANYLQLAASSQKDLEQLLMGWEFSGLPQTFLYDRAGKRVKHIEGNYPKAIRAGVEELLKQS